MNSAQNITINNYGYKAVRLEAGNDRGDVSVELPNGREIQIDAGLGSYDSVAAYLLDSLDYDYTIAIISLNRSHGYVGVTRYTVDMLPTTPEVDSFGPETFTPNVVQDDTGTLFLQYDYQIEDTIGPKGLDYTDTTIARRLIQYLENYCY